jgi:decaprenylphospho-beta-D-erythro-pentofuranosid-2-ulose 2-reductase
METVKSGAAIALFGATSGIARAVALRLASEGEDLILIGRDGPGLAALSEELSRASGRKPPCLLWDVLDHAGHAAHFRALAAAHALKGVFMAAGLQFPQDECDSDGRKPASPSIPT